MDYAQLVMELSAAAGPSGYEDAARDLIKKHLEPLCGEVRTDVMGNIIAIKRCGVPGARSVMLDAHMDEIGFIVTGHENGYLRFATLGGIDPRMLPAAEVRLLTPEPVYGVIDVMPPHALSAEDMDKPLPADKLFIDVGMTQEQAEAAIPLGTPGVYAAGAHLIGEGSICGKSLDDRSCAAIVIKTMEQLQGQRLGVDVICLISTQEEVGVRGATAGAFGAAPDYAIALDVTHGATPDAPKHKTLEMGGGAAIGVGPNCNRRLTDEIIKTAKEEGLPYQLEVMEGCSGTDGWAIQVSGEGIATAIVSLPIKYMHSPIETMRIADGENIIKLMAQFIRRAGEVL